MQGITPTSQTFKKDQQPTSVLRYYDTPFTALQGDVASGGLYFELREPLVDGTWNLPTTIRDSATFDDAEWTASGDSRSVIRNGRWSNAIAYWAAGAPGYFGASWYRKVAMRFRGTFKPSAQRDWYVSGSPAQLQFGVGGSGYVRIHLNGVAIFGGPDLDALNEEQRGAMTEERFLNEGLAWTAAVNVSDGDELDVFYVQRGDENMGGVVIKVLNPQLTTSGLPVDQLSLLAHRREAARFSVVLGCGLFEHAPVTGTVIGMVNNLELDVIATQAPRLEFQVPLVNPVTNDEFGWVWSTTNDKGGHLIGTALDGSQLTMRRNRLITCHMGFRDYVTGSEMWPVFTGFIDDFEGASTGIVTVRCLGFEQRLAEQNVKNYPDVLSYMQFDFHGLKRTTEPVYPIAAYDNWPLEMALRDLMVRAGIDESRMFAPLKVAQADGSMVDAEI